MAKTAQVEQAAVVRTSAGLRDALFDELDALRAGRTNASKANSTAKLADGIINTVRMEMEVQRHLSNIGDQAKVVSTNTLGEPLQLGGASR